MKKKLLRKAIPRYTSMLVDDEMDMKELSQALGYGRSTSALVRALRAIGVKRVYTLKDIK